MILDKIVKTKTEEVAQAKLTLPLVDLMKSVKVLAPCRDFKEAIRDFDRVIELNPKHAEAYYLRGLAYANLVEYRQAIKDYDRAIDLNPKNASAYSDRGHAYGDLGEYRQAREDLKSDWVVTILKVSRHSVVKNVKTTAHTDETAKLMVKRFCNHVFWLRVARHDFKELFENENSKILMERIAPSFFGDLRPYMWILLNISCCRVCGYMIKCQQMPSWYIVSVS